MKLVTPVAAINAATGFLFGATGLLWRDAWG
jgi:hypothetical protein